MESAPVVPIHFRTRAFRDGFHHAQVTVLQAESRTSLATRRGSERDLPPALHAVRKIRQGYPNVVGALASRGPSTSARQQEILLTTHEALHGFLRRRLPV